MGGKITGFVRGGTGLTVFWLARGYICVLGPVTLGYCSAAGPMSISVGSYRGHCSSYFAWTAAFCPRRGAIAACLDAPRRDPGGVLLGSWPCLGLGRASRGSGWVPKGSQSEFSPPSSGGSDGAKTGTFCNLGVKPPVGGKIAPLIRPGLDVDPLKILSF